MPDISVFRQELAGECPSALPSPSRAVPTRIWHPDHSRRRPERFCAPREDFVARREGPYLGPARQHASIVRYRLSRSFDGRSSSDRNQSRLCGNIFGNWRQDAAATTATKCGKSVISSTVAKGQDPLSSHLRHQSLGTKDLDYSPQVVGQYLQTHLGSHSRQGPGEEVGGPHPGLQRSEHVLYGALS